jgi:hypothetical protein
MAVVLILGTIVMNLSFCCVTKTSNSVVDQERGGRLGHGYCFVYSASVSCKSPWPDYGDTCLVTKAPHHAMQSAG